MSKLLQKKATPEFFTLAEQVSTLRNNYLEPFDKIAKASTKAYLELFSLTEPNTVEAGELIQGRAAAWPMYRDRYTSEQERDLLYVTLCALHDGLLSKKPILPMTENRLKNMPFGILARTMFYAGNRAGFSLPLLQSGLDRLRAELAGDDAVCQVATPRLYKIKLSMESQALAALVEDSSRTDREISKIVGCSRTSLYRFAKYKIARAALESGRQDIAKGQKYDGDLDAFDEIVARDTLRDT